MILVSKVLFGSVAVATLAGSVALTDVVEAARRVAVSWRGGSAAEVSRPDPQQLDVQHVGHEQPVAPHAGPYNGMPWPHAPQHCPGRCQIWAVLSQVR